MGKVNWNSTYVRRRYFHESIVKYGEGDYYVYFWQNYNEEPFYVGMGHGYRFTCTHPSARSKEFIEEYNKGGCSVKIVAYGMEERKARDFEKKLILAYHKLGFPLVNKQYLVDYYHTPAKMEFYKNPKRHRTTVK